jgi:excisionase family DNA binding protein
MSTIEPALYDVKDAAAYLHLSRARVYELLAAGDLEARKLGGKTVLLKTEIERYVRSLPVAAIGRKRAA